MNSNRLDYLEIEILKPNQAEDFAALIHIFSDVFEMTELKIPHNTYLKSLLQKPDFFVITAKNYGKVVGGLTVYILHGYYTSKPAAYIYDVGVTPLFQRKGIGKKLIGFLTDYCQQRGFENAYVEAEADDIEAINFYRKTAHSHEMQATHFTYYF